jgi:hypothetical protein
LAEIAPGNFSGARVLFRNQKAWFLLAALLIAMPPPFVRKFAAYFHRPKLLRNFSGARVLFRNQKAWFLLAALLIAMPPPFVRKFAAREVP